MGPGPGPGRGLQRPPPSLIPLCANGRDDGPTPFSEAASHDVAEDGQNEPKRRQRRGRDEDVEDAEHVLVDDDGCDRLRYHRIVLAHAVSIFEALAGDRSPEASVRSSGSRRGDRLAAGAGPVDLPVVPPAGSVQREREREREREKGRERERESFS